MRINEAYDHEPVMPYTVGDAGVRQTGGCDRTAVQCVDISAPVTLTPTTNIGTVVVACQGMPTVTCTTDPTGAACNVVMTQQVCVSIPVQYSVELTPGSSTIACAGDGSATGSCSCRSSNRPAIPNQAKALRPSPAEGSAYRQSLEGFVYRLSDILKLREKFQNVPR